MSGLPALSEESWEAGGDTKILDRILKISTLHIHNIDAAAYWIENIWKAYFFPIDHIIFLYLYSWADIWNYSDWLLYFSGVKNK